MVITTIAILFFTSCSESKIKKVQLDTTKLPELSSDSITTIVSDSGIIRYRIFAPQWDVYDKNVDTPRWEFPQGLHFEKFDSTYTVDANIFCKRAVYYSKLEIWKLNDSVRAVNLQGEDFETNELYWNQKTEKVYSDSAIKITQTDKIINGIGFESNQTFTKYLIRNPQGIIPIDNDDEE